MPFSKQYGWQRKLEGTETMKDIICKKCGVINNYRVEENATHKTAYCVDCGAYIKHLPRGDPEFYFGKYKGAKISDCKDKSYLLWVLENTKQSENYREAIISQINEL